MYTVEQLSVYNNIIKSADNVIVNAQAKHYFDKNFRCFWILLNNIHLYNYIIMCVYVEAHCIYFIRFISLLSSGTDKFCSNRWFW